MGSGAALLSEMMAFELQHEVAATFAGSPFRGGMRAQRFVQTMVPIGHRACTWGCCGQAAGRRNRAPHFTLAPGRSAQEYESWAEDIRLAEDCKPSAHADAHAYACAHAHACARTSMCMCTRTRVRRARAGARTQLVRLARRFCGDPRVDVELGAERPASLARAVREATRTRARVWCWLAAS